MPKRIYSLAFVVSLLVLPGSVFADIGQIVFTTQPQTIEPSIASAVFTVQTQDLSGNSAKTTETTDVNLVSTSPTGEFSSSNTNWQPVSKLTMSTNTSNKNFYYRDPSEGVFTITVTATGRTSGISWNVSQPVTISNAAQSAATSSTADTSGNTTTSNSTSAATATSNVVSVISTHYSYLPLSSFAAAQALSVDAGRPRLAAAGAPIAFHAEANQDEPGVEYDWSFGDGTLATGQDVIHRYEFPGSYAVVLNAKSPMASAVARTSANIIAPDLSIADANSRYIAIKNNAAYEVNLYGWRLAANGDHFDFPRDTIIGANAEVYFPASVTRLPSAVPTRTTVSIIDAPSRITGSAAVPVTHVVANDPGREQKLALIQQKLYSLASEVAALPVAAVSQQSSSQAISQVATPVAAVSALGSGSDATSTPWFRVFTDFLFGRR